MFMKGKGWREMNTEWRPSTIESIRKEEEGVTTIT
jgi:hypothetical protein